MILWNILRHSSGKVPHISCRSCNRMERIMEYWKIFSNMLLILVVKNSLHCGCIAWPLPRTPPLIFTCLANFKLLSSHAEVSIKFETLPLLFGVPNRDENFQVNMLSERGEATSLSELIYWSYSWHITLKMYTSHQQLQMWIKSNLLASIQIHECRQACLWVIAIRAAFKSTSELIFVFLAPL